MKFSTIYEKAKKNLKSKDDSGYEDTLSELNPEDFEKFLKVNKLPYDEVDYNTFGDILIKTEEPHNVYEALIDVESLENHSIVNKAADNLVQVRIKQTQDFDDEAII